MSSNLTIFFFTKVTSEISFLILIFIIFNILIINKRKKDASFLFISAIETIVTIWLLKNIFKISRPENPIIPIDGYAFPSGHAALSAFIGFIVYELFIKKLQKKYRYPILFGIITLILSIGLSRIYFEVHTLIQVIVGYIIGIFIPILVKKMIK